MGFGCKHLGLDNTIRFLCTSSIEVKIFHLGLDISIELWILQWGLDEW